MTAGGWAPRLSALALAVLIAACSTPSTRVTLLPEAGGRASAVVVSPKRGEERTLDQPYQRATALKGGGQPAMEWVAPGAVRAENPALFDLLPPPPERYTVYFEAGGTVLTAESRRMLGNAVDAAMARSGGEILVTGYTDTMGSAAQNDALSRQRAQQVRQMFLDRQFPAARIEAVGRGKRELAVQTADNVDEPRNRRVTIEVR